MTEPADLDAFRAEVRAFIEDNLPSDIRAEAAAGRLVSSEMIARWQRILAEKGWAAPNWPEEHGGVNWTPQQRAAFDAECELNHCPPLEGFGLKMIGPLLISYGTPAQKEKFLPATLRAELNWCQGYSEPGAGSDLASLKTRAVRGRDDQGEHYVVNGSKIWTSMAHVADWMFCLVRTDPDVKPQEGISMLLIDMRSSGLKVRPIIGLNGMHFFNEVFFDDVRVPVENLVGEEHRGWTYGKDLLADERLNLSRASVCRGLLEQLKDIARTEQFEGKPLIEKDSFRREIGNAELRLMALEATKAGFVADLTAGRRLGPEVSMLKLQGSELIQHLDRLLMQAVAHRGLAYDPRWMREGANDPAPAPAHAATLAGHRFRHKGYTIAGGSSEVQRMIIAKRVLGL